MPQKHYAQHGVFHVNTKTKNRIEWCTFAGIPEILIETLCRTRDIHGAQLHAFCILPDHVHMIISPGVKGLSAFMQTFKKNATENVKDFIVSLGHDVPAAENKNTIDTLPNTIKISAGGTSCPAVENIGWQNGFYDERIRDGRQSSAAMAYVHGNGMKHHLVKEIEDWPWTSLHFPAFINPMELWLD